MSHRITIACPFISRDFLIESLNKLNISYSEMNNQIVLKTQYSSFVKQGNNYNFITDTDYRNKDLIAQIEKKYKEAEFEFNEKIRKAEEERYLQELERLKKEKEELERKKKEEIENKKSKIKENAKKHGYSVQEKTENGEIKLILVRRTY